MILSNTWIPWSDKSSHLSFKSTEIAVGDGEQKLAAEFDVKPLGQNVSYDLNVRGERWEVKKLDSDNSFRLGVEVSSSYREIINSVTRIFEQLILIENHLIDSDIGNSIRKVIREIVTTSGRTSTLLITGLKKNEVSSSNLNKANLLIKNIKELKFTENKYIKLYSSYNGKKLNYDYLTAFKKLSLESISIEDKLSVLNCSRDLYNKLLLSNSIADDISYFKDLSLKEKLDNLVRSIFTDTKLVLVHKKLGFKVISDLEKIYCNRITSGNPRCKVLN